MAGGDTGRRLLVSGPCWPRVCSRAKSGWERRRDPPDRRRVRSHVRRAGPPRVRRNVARLGARSPSFHHGHRDNCLNARALVSLVRAAAVILRRDVASLPANGVWWRAALWLVAPVVLHYLVYGPRFPAIAPLVDRPTFALLLFPGMIAAGAPLAFFMATLWRPRSRSPATPFVGLAALSLVFAIAWVGWITPMANQEFRERTYALHGGQGILAKGQAELSLPQLLSAQNERTRAARIQISNRLLLMCGVR